MAPNDAFSVLHSHTFCFVDTELCKNVGSHRWNVLLVFKRTAVVAPSQRLLCCWVRFIKGRHIRLLLDLLRVEVSGWDAETSGRFGSVSQRAPSTIECFGACIFEDSNLIFICRDFQSGEKIG